MAGYSGTPLPKKLGFKPGSTVLIRQAPADFAALLEPLPDDVVLVDEIDSPVSVIVAFYTAHECLATDFPRLRNSLAANGRLWIACPKRASKRPTDLDEDNIRDLGLATGLVDVKVCAIDEVWSGLCFMFRKADRPRT